MAKKTKVRVPTKVATKTVKIPTESSDVKEETKTTDEAPVKQVVKEPRGAKEDEPRGAKEDDPKEDTPATTSSAPSDPKEDGDIKEPKEPEEDDEETLDPMLVRYEEMAEKNIMQDRDSLRALNLHFHRYLMGILRPAKDSVSEFNKLLRRMHKNPDTYGLMMITRGVPDAMADGALPDWWMGLMWLLDKLSDPKEAPKLSKEIDLSGLVEGMPQAGFEFLQMHLEIVSRY